MSIKEISFYDVNPFEINYSEFVKIDKFGGVKQIDAVVVDTGEKVVLNTVSKASTFITDSSTFVKLFPKKIVDMTKTWGVGTFHLFFYIVSELGANKDVVYVDCDDFLERFGYSMNSRKVFYDAIVTLLNAGVVARRDNKLYWINHNLFFNGNRRKLIKDMDKVSISDKGKWKKI